MPGWSRVRRGADFRYRDSRGELAARRRRDIAHSPPRDTTGLRQGMDLPGRERPPAGHRDRRAWPQTVPLSRRMAHVEGRTQIRAAGSLRRALPAIRRRVARDLAAAPRHRSNGRWCWPRWCACSTPPSCASATRNMPAATAPTASRRCATSTSRHPRQRAQAAFPRQERRASRGPGGRCADRGAIVRRCQQLPGQELFQYLSEDGIPRAGYSSTDVNDYLREIADGDFTAKDYRTWHGTVQALELTRMACSSD